MPRRKRKLNLYQLIAGVLLIYPVYYDWKLKGFVDCEAVINRIIEERTNINLKIKSKLPKIFKKNCKLFQFSNKEYINK